MWRFFWLCCVAVPACLVGEASMCYKDIEKDFFREAFVSQALNLHTVSQSTWTPINIRLRQNARKVPELVKQRAAGMRRNPFNYPFQPEEAGEVLMQVLFEVFASTLAEFNINNASDVSQMFRYLRDRQQERLVACFGKSVLDEPQ